MILEIITPEKKLFSGEVTSVKLPGANGEFEILNNHAPIISTLCKGKIRLITKDKNTEKYDINGGVIEVQKNKMIVLAD
jgi:F-type H+-transporting ATPase subunit epsilon